ncbi:hypothetical protein M427DRAFT_108958 [Gonapodya prolifera JEL478]|uniref:HCP-like protein n=1 Tax=Gonapodya prolifera (strain JEL478) TaxID=1344416 RepID=A0A139AQT3_GONPJ|nr:hypothetical protein M427DRAFT_108958 [Gonapodya prolifera JEL478]|eukprot:KXS19096.1 hypothetical protein M427DRAFT_108958 [Gonapodya prolifera JEL478]
MPSQDSPAQPRRGSKFSSSQSLSRALSNVSTSALGGLFSKAVGVPHHRSDHRELEPSITFSPTQHGRTNSVALSDFGDNSFSLEHQSIPTTNGLLDDPRTASWRNHNRSATHVFSRSGASSLNGSDSGWESSTQRTPSPALSDTRSLTDRTRDWRPKWGRSKHQFASMPAERHGLSRQKSSHRRAQSALGIGITPMNRSGGVSPVPGLAPFDGHSALASRSASLSLMPVYSPSRTPSPAPRLPSRAESYTEGLPLSPSALLAPPPVHTPKLTFPTDTAVIDAPTTTLMAGPPPRRKYSVRRSTNEAPLPSLPSEQLQSSQSTLDDSADPTSAPPVARIASRHATFKAAINQLQRASSDSPLPSPSSSNSETDDDGFGAPKVDPPVSASTSIEDTAVPVVLIGDIEAEVEEAMTMSYEVAERAVVWAKATTDEGEQFDVLEFLLDHLALLPPPPPNNPDRAVTLALSIVALLRNLAYKSYDPRAQYTMGNLYVTGLPDNCRKKDKHGNPEVWKPRYARAHDLWVMAGKRNHADAIYNSALCSERGLGTARSAQRALRLYRKAAALNHPGAMTRLAQALLYSNLGATKNLRDGVKWLTLAVSCANDRFPGGCVELAKCYSGGLKNGVVIRDEEYAFRLLLKGAELGDPEAYFRLARCFETGELSTKIRHDLAVQHYSIAAALGHAEAALEMSGLHLAGYPIHLPPQFSTFTLPQSDTLALQYAVVAAEHGLPRGMFALGYFYDNGIGTKQDAEAAAAWYMEAAKRGDLQAWKRLKEMGKGDWKWALFASRKEREARKAIKKLVKLETKEIAEKLEGSTGTAASLRESISKIWTRRERSRDPATTEL